MQLRSLQSSLEQSLTEAGLDPDRLEPWGAWRVFKAFARTPVSDCDLDACQLTLGRAATDDGFIHLVFSRHLAIADDEEFDVVAEVHVDLGYDPEPALDLEPIELHDADYPSFADFVAAVEAHPAVQAAFVKEPAGSLVTVERG